MSSRIKANDDELLPKGTRVEDEHGHGGTVDESWCENAEGDVVSDNSVNAVVWRCTIIWFTSGCASDVNCSDLWLT
jgi:hypothetical protein